MHADARDFTSREDCVALIWRQALVLALLNPPPWVYRKIQRKQVPDLADFDCPRQNPSAPSNPIASRASQVIGNKRSHIYHRPDCPGYAKVSTNNQALFPDATAAEEAGYRLTGNCP